ncbi:hypothetical protein EBESD8_18140 [Rhodococcus aetherivorans]|nr:hypothetical protein EBESD8_18140 [Rhodococcus aetherivorans]
MGDHGIEPVAPRPDVEVVARVVADLGPSPGGGDRGGVRGCTAVEVGDLDEQRAPQSGGVLARPVGTEFERDACVDLVAPRRAGECRVVLEISVQGQCRGLAGAAHDRNRYGRKVSQRRDSAAGPDRGGPQHRRHRMVPRRQQTCGGAVDQRCEGDDGRDVPAVCPHREHMSTRQRHTPQDQAIRVGPVEAGGGAQGGPIVVRLAAQVDPLTRRTTGRAESPVVEGEDVETCRGEPLRERLEAGILGAAEPVRHHDDRAAAVTGERLALPGEVPGVAERVTGSEGLVSVCHSDTFSGRSVGWTRLPVRKRPFPAGG